MRHIIQIVLAVGFVFLSFEAVGQSPTLKASLKRGAITGSVSLGSTDSSCIVVLYGAGSRSGLDDTSPISHTSKRKPLTEFHGTFTSKQFRTSKLPNFFSRTPRIKQIFLRADRTCSGTASSSSVVSFKVATSSKSGVRSVNAWLGSARLSLLKGRISLVDVFPAITFTKPIYLTSAIGATFVIEQGALIKTIENAGTTTNTFLDLRDRVETNGFEQGLLGAAFKANSSGADFYVNYTAKNGGDTVVSRFSYDNTGLAGNPNSEVELLRFSQPFDNHNGGHIELVGETQLYIASGDGGSGGDPEGNGQKLGTFLGKILRIDVTNSQYSVPLTNPFVGQSGAKEEIFAYGLRNPWRFSRDPVTGLIWAGDVGQGTKEEVDIIRSGGNYGWNKQEGKGCFPPETTTCSKSGLVQPIAEYGRDFGASITGGYVYRGTEFPALEGLYIFGDFVSGRIFAIDYDSKDPQFLTLLESNEAISSFGVDREKVLYLLSYDKGKVLKVTVN